ncbi:MAG: cobalamin biosynthesis protein CbiM [Chloroflexi bacterium RBG_16_50_9]|nr:MAG: cobalamin biosynthesis protein CbiM [Chloroflexi bacterium RBG_16_50_9]
MLYKSACWLRNHIILVLSVALGLILFYPTPAYAMHIAEGILPWHWAAIWYAAAAVFVTIGVIVIRRRTGENKGLLPLFGLAGAAVFLISVFPVPVPISGTSSHPCGTPLAAILVGPFISTVLGAIALLIQALFLAHGGLTTWGANILSMAVAGSFVGFGAFLVLRRLNAPIFVAGFTAGVLGDWATYAVTSFELAAALRGAGSLWSMWGTLALAFAPTQLPLGILEGIFTAAVVALVYQRRPELLKHVIPLTGRPVVSTAKGGNQ